VRPNRTARTPLLAAILTLAAAVTLAACDLARPAAPPDRTGVIKEVEAGRNGVKVEVYADRTGEEDYEVYLAPGMENHCRTDQRLTDCADDDDYLVPRPGARLGR
jgi:hypothetical protein